MRFASPISQSPIARCLWFGVALGFVAALSGCGGDGPAPLPEMFEDARLADAEDSDLKTLREIGGDGVIVEEESNGEMVLALYLSAADTGDYTVTDDDLKLAARIPNISRLYLTSTKVTDAGMDEVAKMSSLVSVNLDATSISDAGLEKLRALQGSLKTVFCKQTNVTTAGVAKFREETGILVTH